MLQASPGVAIATLPVPNWRIDVGARRNARWHDTMKDNLAALEGLGFTLPSTAYVIGIVIFGIGGYFAYRYGKKMSLHATKWIGIALMLSPYVISATWLLYAVGAALCIGEYVTARA